MKATKQKKRTDESRVMKIKESTFCKLTDYKNKIIKRRYEKTGLYASYSYDEVIQILLEKCMDLDESDEDEGLMS